MSYTKPIIVEVSLNVEHSNSKNMAGGKETASGCSGSCCYKEGTDW